MSALTDFLLTSMSGAIETLGESKMVDLLQQLKTSNPSAYEATIHAGYLFVQKLQPLVDKTKTPIDNVFVQAIKEAIETSAANNNITIAL